jgi:membrane-anchored glycerophosphoryl diester phosphodiesterase (GDPDase)
MNKNDLLKNVLLNILYVVILIAMVTLVSVIVAGIGENFTRDINAIVIACLTSAWVTIVTMNILKCFIVYGKKVRKLDKNNVEEYKKETKTLKKKNIITVTVSSIFIGFVLYKLKNELVNSITNETEIIISENIFDSSTFYVKTGSVFVLVIILIVKIIVK